MGNCQAIDAATLVIQHPNGKVDRFYCPVNASEIMRMNPGHYVALLISTTMCPSNSKEKENYPDKNGGSGDTIRLTRIKLLKPTDTLVLGQVYRLITTHEVMKGLLAKKHAKMRNNQSEASKEKEKENPNLEDSQVGKVVGDRPTATSKSSAATARSRTWQPSLQSISEASS